MSIEISGAVICGFPSPGIENREGPLDFNEYLVKHKSTTYCLRAYGASMLPDILPDDILIVDKSLSAKDGDIVIAESYGDFTVKKLRIVGHDFFLIPSNPEYETIKITEKMQLFGVVTSIVRKLRK